MKKNEDVPPAPRRRTVASAVTVIAAVALVSLLLEWAAGSHLKDIVYSFAVFGFILAIAAVRFSGRKQPGPAEKLWITAAWDRVTGLVAWLLRRGHAAPPADPSPLALALHEGKKDDRVRPRDAREA